MHAAFSMASVKSFLFSIFGIEIIPCRFSFLNYMMMDILARKKRSKRVKIFWSNRIDFKLCRNYLFCEIELQDM